MNTPAAEFDESPKLGAVLAVDEVTREWVLRKLGSILDIAMARVAHPKTPAEDRIKWSRIVVSAGQACNSVLRDVEIDALKQQIDELKQLTLAKLSDEQVGDQEGDTKAPENS